jgi:hypothetical protein
MMASFACECGLICALDVGCAGVVVGLLALGEAMPKTLGMQALRLLSWVCITMGVSALAGGQGDLVFIFCLGHSVPMEGVSQS